MIPTNQGSTGGSPRSEEFLPFRLIGDPIKNAAVSLQRNLLGIKSEAENDIISLADIGKKNRYNYSSDAENPVLDHKISNLMAYNDTASNINDQSWKQIYKDLRDNVVSNDVQDAINANAKLPPETKNHSLSALDGVLMFAAKGIARINNASAAINQTEAADSPVALRQMANEAMPIIAMAGIKNQSVSTFANLESKVNQLGSNDPQSDGLTAIINDLGAGYNAVWKG